MDKPRKAMRRPGQNEKIQQMGLQMTQAMFQVLERDHGFTPDMLAEFHAAWLAQMKANRVEGLKVAKPVIEAMGGEVQK